MVKFINLTLIVLDKKTKEKIKVKAQVNPANIVLMYSTEEGTIIDTVSNSFAVSESIIQINILINTM